MIAVWPTSGTNNRLVVKPSGTRDKVNKSGTVLEILGQLEPMHIRNINRHIIRAVACVSCVNNHLEKP